MRPIWTAASGCSSSISRSGWWRVSARLADPFLLGAPINVVLRFVDVFAAAAEAEDRPAHQFDRDVAGEDEQIGPADVAARTSA